MTKTEKIEWLKFCLENTVCQINVIHLTGQIITLEEELLKEC